MNFTIVVARQINLASVVDKGDYRTTYSYYNLTVKDVVEVSDKCLDLF